MLNTILIDLFTACILYIIAAYMGVHLMRNKEFIVPVLFGLIYGGYLAWSRNFYGY